MELRHLRYFAALADKLHFTRAAEQVHVTQSTLSHQIRQLEEELGKQLFDRVGKRVFLTQDGQLFLTHVSRSLAELDAGLMSLKAPAQELEGKVRIGATATLAEIFVPQCVATYLQRSPLAKVTMVVRTTEEISRDIREERLDIGIAYPPIDTTGLWFEPLFEEAMRVVVRDSHPLAKRRRIRLVDLHRQKMLSPDERFSFRQVFDGYFRSVGAEPAIMVDGAGGLAAIRVLVAAMDIAAILPESACPREGPFKAIPIEGPAPTRTPSIYLKRDRAQSAPIRTMVETFKRAGFTRMQKRQRRRR